MARTKSTGEGFAALKLRMDKIVEAKLDTTGQNLSALNLARTKIIGEGFSVLKLRMGLNLSTLNLACTNITG